MSYSALANYLKIGWPKSRNDIANLSTEYVYVGPYSTLSSNRPTTGASAGTWADGNYVVASELVYLTPTTAAAPYGELTVTTGYAVAQTDTSSNLEESTYELQWMEVDRPLEMHPIFDTGGAHALSTTDWEKILLWEGTQNPSQKAYGYYYLKDANGVAYGDPIALSGNAATYCAYSVYGITSYAAYLPVWTKTSTYRGNNAPGVSDIGAKGTPSGSGYPSGYEWRKNDDRSTRIGNRAQWRRFESWIGAYRVWVDRTTLY